MKSARRSWLVVCPAAVVILGSLWGSNLEANSAVSESPSSLSFGSVTVDTASSAQGFTVTNTGSQKVTIEKVASSSSQFEVTGPTLPLTLSAGQGASFLVVFAPTSAGTFSGSISISCNRLARGGRTVAVSGTGVSAAPTPASTGVLSPSATSLSLGSVLVGGSSTQSVVLSNTGSGSLTVSQVSVTGAGFTVSGVTTPLTLAEGQAATLTVAFSPAAAGSVTGSVSAVSNATNSPTTIALSGTGVAQTFLLSPSINSLSFGSILVGSTSSSQSVSLINTGNSNVTISQVAVSGAGFTVSGITVPLTLAAGQSASLTAGFSPTVAGSITGSITVTSNATNSPTTIALSGSGTAQTFLLSPSVTSLSFGNVLVGSASGSQSISLSNTGNSSVTISQVTVSGAGFTASGITTPLTLAAGQSAALSAIYSPTAAGSIAGSISVVSNATNSPATITLSGTGIQPQISVVPTSVAFGSVAVGSSTSQTMSIQNSGTAPLSVTQATASSAGFAVSGLTLPLTVAAGGSASFTVSFTPTSASNFSASLALVSNAPGSPTSVALTGTGLAQSLQLSASPTSLSFGNETVGSTSSSQTVTISNTGNSTVSVTQITASSAAFSISGITLPISLSAGQSTSFAVVFAPTSQGSLTGSISIVSTASNSPTTVALSGTGVATSYSVSLSWSDGSSGLAGYNVYRGTTSGGPYTMINSSLVPTAAYTDTTVQSGTTYYYVSTAVNSAGTESGYSNQATAVIP